MSREGQLNRIEGKLEKIADRLGSIDVTLAKQEESLSFHIKRTNQLESVVSSVVKHIQMINGIIKFIAAVFATTAFIAGVVKIIEYLSKFF